MRRVFINVRSVSRDLAARVLSPSSTEGNIRYITRHPTRKQPLGGQQRGDGFSRVGCRNNSGIQGVEIRAFFLFLVGDGIGETDTMLRLRVRECGLESDLTSSGFLLAAFGDCLFSSESLFGAGGTGTGGLRSRVGVFWMPGVGGAQAGLAAARDVQDRGFVDALLADRLDRLDELREGVDGLEGHGSFLVRVKVARGVKGPGGDAGIQFEHAIEGRRAIRGEGFWVWEAVFSVEPNPDAALVSLDRGGEVLEAESQLGPGGVHELLPRRAWRDVLDSSAAGRQRLL